MTCCKRGANSAGRLLSTLNDDAIEQVAQRVIGLNLIGIKDKARVTITKAYELGKTEDLREAVSELQETSASADPESTSTHISPSGRDWGLCTDREGFKL